MTTRLAAPEEPPDGPGRARGSLKAPFPYFGGKAKVAAQVWQRLGNPDTYVEPFGGSLAVLLARPLDHAWWTRRETVGDFSGHIVNFYRAVQADPAAVAEKANWPVTEADLTARHLYLVRYQNTLAERLAGDPAFYDVLAAGWWIWGVSAWVGGEWCSGLGPWHPGSDTGPGVYRKLPMVAGNHSGKGVHRPVSVPVTPGETPAVTEAYRAHLVDQFTVLSDRLRRVRIACGDWSRLTKSAVVPSAGQVAAVFLDPPYDLTLRRGDLYGPGDRDADAGTAQVHVKAREWALGAGQDPRFRIAYCTYSNAEEDAVFAAAGWKPLRWSAHGGYGLQAENAARDNRDLEVIWFSGACLPTPGTTDDLFTLPEASEKEPRT